MRQSATHYIIRGVMVSTLSLITYKLCVLYAPSARLLVSHCLSYFNNTNVRMVGAARRNFHELSIPWVPPVRNHTHPTCAADRTAAISMIQSFSTTVGREVYSVSMSKKDQREGKSGSRDYYWARDLDVAVRNDPLDHQRHLLMLVDVDYYVDIHDLLLNFSGPVILYTLVPESASFCEKEYSFNFNQESEVVMDIHGGAKYTHSLWDWNSDTITVTRPFNPFRPMVNTHATYNVERKRVSKNHYVILLVPIATFRGLPGFLANTWLSNRPLSRLNVIQKLGNDVFVRFRVQTGDGVMTTTGSPGSYSSATISSVVDDEIATISRISKYPLTIPSILDMVDKDRGKAAKLVEYHRHATKQLEPVIVAPIDAVRRYQYNSYYDDTAKPSLHAYMSPLIHGAWAPDMTVENERRAIASRITDIRSDAQLSVAIAADIEEFIKFFVPVPYVLHPFEVDEVYERQTRPEQRRLIETGVINPPNRVVNSFMKKEAYQGPNDPRFISTINPADKVTYSQFVYPVGDYVKMSHWYAFGKTPREVAERVAEIARSAGVLLNTDFSRMDGRVSEVARHFEKQLMMRLYPADYHAKLNDQMRSQQNLVGFGTFGTTYETGTSRLSGSPETSVFNSCLTAVIHYSTYKRCVNPRTGQLYTPDEAYAQLGVYGGDDGLSADLVPEVATKVAKWYGQVLTLDVIKRGDAGVKFLARVYSPLVWSGATSSCCDLPRTLSKFHTCVGICQDPRQKLIDKCLALWYSDRNSPIAGRLARAVLRLAKLDPTTKEVEMIMSPETPYMNRVPASDQYPNEREDEWMTKYVETCLPSFNRDLFDQTLRRAKSVEDLLECPLMAPAPYKLPKEQVVTPVEVIRPEQPKATSRRDKKQKPSSQKATPKGEAKAPKSRAKQRDNAKRGKGKKDPHVSVPKKAPGSTPHTTSSTQPNPLAGIRTKNRKH